MYSHQFDQHRAAKMQDATEEMIRMRRPAAPPAPVIVETADGFMVISKLHRPSSVKPPYSYQYDADHYDTLEDAEEHYRALEAGEYRGWQPVAIVACKRGIPLGSKKVL